MAERIDAYPELITWPVLACLTPCGHFRAFSVEESPTLGQAVECFECGTRALVGEPRRVYAAVSVADLVRLLDKDDV